MGTLGSSHFRCRFCRLVAVVNVELLDGGNLGLSGAELVGLVLVPHAEVQHIVVRLGLKDNKVFRKMRKLGKHARPSLHLNKFPKRVGRGWPTS